MPADADTVRLDLIAPSSDEITQWFGERLGSAKQAELFYHARHHNPDFVELSDALPNLELFLEAIRAQSRYEPSAPLDRWIAGAVIEYVRLLRTMQRPGLDERGFEIFFAELEDMALHEFALALTPKDLVRVKSFQKLLCSPDSSETSCV
jgi:hypothetical protein